ncbi:hypothetical protein P0082_01725 [Candidatus Haliotispira prima]|uniref:4-diphosphocytidyl-2-C-methyl-D-erythritol kinase n=1 Tax=Candidatus Haliotispira prima TaxID=3034016 RepID=A0ABY8MHU9_9SPIO|nr:hypothetical protein P0082_01725 [Candidatus Haliotispira prima]
MAILKGRTTCPAKINLHLAVGEPYIEKHSGRSFHRICTLMQGVYFQGVRLNEDKDQLEWEEQGGDLLELELSPERVQSRDEVQLTLEAQPAPCPTEDNLVCRAAKAYVERLDCRFWPQRMHFSLKKRIPQEAGLGGGSANAAITLKLLNRLLPPYCGSPALSVDTMSELAAGLGSDVPFFLRDFGSFPGSLAWCLGRGEQVVSLSERLVEQWQELQSQYRLWLVKPRGISCPTGEMYRRLDSRPRRAELDHLMLERQLSGLMAEGLSENSPLVRFLHNDFSLAVRALAGRECPGAGETGAGETGDIEQEKQTAEKYQDFRVLATLPQYLYSLAASWAAMSGSGSSFFVWFPAGLSQMEILKGLTAFPHPLEIFAGQSCSVTTGQYHLE